MPAITPYVYLSLTKWCREVSQLGALFDQPNTFWRYRPGGFEHYGPPDVLLASDQAEVEYRGNFGLDRIQAPQYLFDDKEMFPYLTRNFSLFTEDVFVAALDDVVMQRVSLGKERYHLILDRGVIAAESHGSAIHADKYAAVLKDVLPVNVAGKLVPVKIYEESPVDTVVEEPCVFLHDIWMHNYAHWIVEVVSRLWLLEACPQMASLPAVIPPYPDGSFQDQIIRAVLPDVRRYPLPGNVVRFKRLYFPTMLSPGGFTCHQIEWTDALLRRALDCGPPQHQGRRLYISRADAAVRRVADEDELFARLKALDFTTHTLGSLTVRQQIELFSEAGTIVIPHGANCANLVFAPPGTRVIELVPASSPHTMYWMISKLKGHLYGRIVCPDEGPQQELHVPADLLTGMLEKLWSLTPPA